MKPKHNNNNNDDDDNNDNDNTNMIMIICLSYFEVVFDGKCDNRIRTCCSLS